MEPKKIALLVGAVVIALVCGLMVRSLMMSSAAAPVAAAMPQVSAPEPKGPKVLVATRPLPVGTILDDTAYAYKPWPKELVQNVYYVEGQPLPQYRVVTPTPAAGAPESAAPVADKANPEAAKPVAQAAPENGAPADARAFLRGSVVRTAVSAGQPITMGSVVQPGDRGFLAAALGAGMRAITVQVNAVTGVAGFVFPGDRVDLMLTQSVSGEGSGSGAGLKTAETIMSNLRVLAADQRTTGEDEKGQKVVAVTSSVTLEVTPRIAEKIQVAMSIGSLSLSLRPLAENRSDLERAIASGEVNVPDGSNPAAERAMMARVSARPSDRNTSYVTGGDVSRFQRRSIAVQADPALPNSRAGAPRAGITVVPKPPVVVVANGTAITEVSVGAK